MWNEWKGKIQAVPQPRLPGRRHGRHRRSAPALLGELAACPCLAGRLWHRFPGVWARRGGAQVPPQRACSNTALPVPLLRRGPPTLVKLGFGAMMPLLRGREPLARSARHLHARPLLSALPGCARMRHGWLGGRAAVLDWPPEGSMAPYGLLPALAAPSPPTPVERPSMRRAPCLHTQ